VNTRGLLLQADAKAKDYFSKLKASENAIKQLETEIFKSKS